MRKEGCEQFEDFGLTAVAWRASRGPVVKMAPENASEQFCVFLEVGYIGLRLALIELKGI